MYVGRRTHRLDLAGVNADDPDLRGDQLLPQRVCEAPDRGLGGAVDAAAGVRLAAGDGADVDDVSRAGLASRLQDGQDGLGHVDEARHVRGEHDVDVLLCDLRRLRDAPDETTAGLMVSWLMHYLP